MSGKKRMSHYPLETKLEAIRLFYEEGKTRAQITAQLGIRDADGVKKWLRQYRRGGGRRICQQAAWTRTPAQEREPSGLYRPAGNGE